jgi:prevent-host-death family protein
MIATATATEFNRDPSKLLGRSERGDTILVSSDGKPAAALIPQPKPTSGAELARRLEKMKPAPETADAISEIIKGMDEAA